MSYTANDWQWYGTEGLQVVPYMPGTPVYKDGLLPHLYYKTKEEGKLEAVFHEDGFNLDKFVAFFEKRKTLQCLCEVDEDQQVKPVGYSWVDAPSGIDGARAALCGFCFFDGAGSRESARDLGRLGIAYWLMALRIDVIHGVILEANTQALNYAKRVGFEEVAYVPKWRCVEGKLVGVRVVTLNADEYLPVFWQWRERNPVAVPE